MSHFIETTRLYVDAPTLSDADNWCDLHRDVEIMRHIGGARDRQTSLQWLKDDISHFEKHGFCLASVFEKSTENFIGRAGIVYFDYDDTQTEIEIGYELKKEYWNKGYATELVLGIIKWGFTHLNLSRLVAVCRPENIASQHVVKKSGLRFEKELIIRDSNFYFYAIFRN
jgi:ribosomal-protein-alanine N-acetyltransferase